MRKDKYLRIHRLLDDHYPTDQKEIDAIALIRQMLNDHENIMNRECTRGHITGSALVINRTSGRMLLHFHKSLNRWLQLGGHMDEGELDPSQTALREAQEESGMTHLKFLPEVKKPRPMDIDVHIIPATTNKPEHLHLDFRYLLASPNSTMGFINKNESKKFQWLTLLELQRSAHMIDASLLRFVQKANIALNEYVSSTV